MARSFMKTPQLRDMLIALLHDLLDAADEDGVPGWHIIREAEEAVWRARSVGVKAG